MLGPPFTCPLPNGAGYRTILYRNDEPVFCQTYEESSCPEGYECIQSVGLSTITGNGVCCPRKGNFKIKFPDEKLIVQMEN